MFSAAGLISSWAVLCEDFFVFIRTWQACGHGHCRERAISFEVFVQCADVFHCKAVRAMISSKRHVVILMAVRTVYVHRADVRTSIATNLPGECASCRRINELEQNDGLKRPFSSQCETPRGIVRCNLFEARMTQTAPVSLGHCSNLLNF